MLYINNIEHLLVPPGDQEFKQKLIELQTLFGLYKLRGDNVEEQHIIAAVRYQLGLIDKKKGTIFESCGYLKLYDLYAHIIYKYISNFDSCLSDDVGNIESYKTFLQRVCSSEQEELEP